MGEEYALELIEGGKRLDGRGFEEFRKIEIIPNFIENAEGSAKAKLGKTEVIAGVKLETGEPFEDTPNAGILIVNSEFTPLASPDFESGPPGEDAVELSRVVDRGLRESKCIKLEDLCIEAGKKVWCVFIDIHIINNHGNLLDAAALASLSALLHARIPKLDGEKILRGDFEKQLPMQYKPVNVTVCKVGDKFLLDPSLEEENVVEAKLSVAVMDDDRICSMQKQGVKELELADLEKMVRIAVEKSKELRKLVA